MPITFRAVLLSLCCLVLAAPVFATCDSDFASSGYRGDLGADDFTDLAWILRSSQVAGCQTAAHDKLLSKLTAVEQWAAANPTQPHPWKKRWSGVSLSFALSTGLILGRAQLLDATLDQKLANAANNYARTNADACGHNNFGYRNGNTCFEEYAIATLAYGWRTAYYRLTARDWLGERSNTLAGFQSTLSEQFACVHDSTQGFDTSGANRGFCNSTLAALEADTSGNIELVTLNHGAQVPAYGIGQMAHIAAAFVGLEVAQRPVVPTQLNVFYKNMARQIWREGVAKATSSGAFQQYGCRRVDDASMPSASLSNPEDVCWDPQKLDTARYRADHFPVGPFYRAYSFPQDLRSGQTLNFDFENERRESFTDDVFYEPGRYEAYVTMAKYWLNLVGQRPLMSGSGSYKGGILRTPSWFMVSSGGGGTPTANGSATDGLPRAVEETHTIEDLSPTTPLMNGDYVRIKNKDGYYWEATNGGGSSVVARYTTPTTYAQFQIVKWGPYTNEPIAHDDIFSFKTSNGWHYLVAPVGGSLSATSTSIVVDEGFRLHRLKTD